MQVLGAILAGGEARRFGSDKAQALYHGERLIDRVANALIQQSDALIICGRQEEGFNCIPDQPEPGIGPLGGLNAALIYAAKNGFTHLLSAPCDTPNLPHDLVHVLAGTDASSCAVFVQSQPVIGLWPIVVADDLASYIAAGHRSAYGFAERINAEGRELAQPLANINRPEDLG